MFFGIDILVVGAIFGVGHTLASRAINQHLDKKAEEKKAKEEAAKPQ